MKDILELYQLIHSKLAAQDKFTQRLTLKESRALYMYLRKKGGRKQSSGGRHRLIFKDTFVTFSPKDTYVHLLVSKHLKSF